MIYLSCFDSVLGPVSVAECKRRVLLVQFGSLDPADGPEAVRSREALERLGEVVRRASGPCAEHLRRYLMGEDERLRLAVDLSLVLAPFRRTVLKALYKTRPGDVLSYQQLAELAGAPRAARAVGGAMSSNPLAIVVPCHRVVPAGGGLGNYTGGVDKKQWLLAREGHAGLSGELLPNQLRSWRPPWSMSA